MFTSSFVTNQIDNTHGQHMDGICHILYECQRMDQYRSFLSSRIIGH